jgi:glycosyltransferase involved in cell wall biosynthesis
MNVRVYPTGLDGHMPTVSVLIPSYNGASYIASAIDSVLQQDGVDLEIIVVDDNSTDGTVSIVERYDDPRVRLFQNAANLGPESNWNRALELAEGAYIKLLPQDDLLLPGCLAAQVAALAADTEETIAIVFGSREIIDKSGRVITRRGFNGATGRIAAPNVVRACVRKGTNVIGEPGAVLFRRSLAKRIGRFNSAQPYVIDLDYWVRLLAHGDAWYIERPVSAFRVSSSSWSVAIGACQSRQFADFLDRVRQAGLISVSHRDVVIGKIQAKFNNILRLLFYKLVVR